MQVEQLLSARNILDLIPGKSYAKSIAQILSFTVYPRESNVVLGVEDLTEILNRACIFLPQALENNDSV